MEREREKRSKPRKREDTTTSNKYNKKEDGEEVREKKNLITSLPVVRHGRLGMTASVRAPTTPR